MFLVDYWEQLKLQYAFDVHIEHIHAIENSDDLRVPDEISDINTDVDDVYVDNEEKNKFYEESEESEKNLKSPTQNQRCS